MLELIWRSGGSIMVTGDFGKMGKSSMSFTKRARANRIKRNKKRRARGKGSKYVAVKI